jgi:hypothetical protein
MVGGLSIVMRLIPWFNVTVIVPQHPPMTGRTEAASRLEQARTTSVATWHIRRHNELCMIPSSKLFVERLQHL